MLHIRRVKFYCSLPYFRQGWCRRLVFQIQHVRCAHQLLHDVVTLSTLCRLQYREVLERRHWQSFPRDFPDHPASLLTPRVPISFVWARRCTAEALAETHTSTLLINGWVPLPQARGVGAGRFIWYIVAARSALLHWTLSNTCSPIRGCCVGVARLCHCTDWHCPVGAAERMKYEIPSDKKVSCN